MKHSTLSVLTGIPIAVLAFTTPAEAKMIPDPTAIESTCEFSIIGDGSGNGRIIGYDVTYKSSYLGYGFPVVNAKVAFANGGYHSDVSAACRAMDKLRCDTLTNAGVQNLYVGYTHFCPYASCLTKVTRNVVSCNNL